MVYDREGFNTNELGHLTIDGVDTVSLAHKYGTPLYVYNVDLIRRNAQAFTKAFQKHGITGQIAYASKAFSTIAMLQVMKQEGLSLDVVSVGELHTALKADFPVQNIHLHGNNKSTEEISMALEHNIGCIVIDNFRDIDVLEELLKQKNQHIDVLIRVTPGVNSATHRYIMTGHEDSKFGFDLHNGQADEAMERLIDHSHIRIKGLHCHIGSQIFSPDAYVLAADHLFQKLKAWHQRFGYYPEVMNFGGGFGIQYTKADTPIPFSHYVDALVKVIDTHVKKLGMPFPEIWLEPGRAIAGNAGITLYTVGSFKHIPDVRTYLAVDGGMTDNLRPALYDAKYDGIVANKATMDKTAIVSIAGKCCESGDMLIDNLSVASPETGDILAVFSTGAYGYSMANNYNRFPKAAVVFVENGKDHLVVRRETLDDIVKHDLSYE
ncbi:diaminopimelate decarboxylase [Lentibacillus saliphilus]|uniref:diaminopimelate decarboxylase n=1 Tax=Lentibacillus saliphilus TaxID=2737028 RepID=UPI001C2F8C67|nr:diaminopimelate decarboxylase [Lentibacillus saliphilus]